MQNSILFLTRTFEASFGESRKRIVWLTTRTGSQYIPGGTILLGVLPSKLNTPFAEEEIVHLGLEGHRADTFNMYPHGAIQALFQQGEAQERHEVTSTTSYGDPHGDNTIVVVARNEEEVARLALDWGFDLVRDESNPNWISWPALGYEKERRARED